MIGRSPEENNNLLELLKIIWLPVAGFIGVATATYNFYKMWLGDQGTVTILTAGLGILFILFTLLWISFSKKNYIHAPEKPFGHHRNEKVYRYSPKHRHIAQIILILMVIGSIAGCELFIKHIQALKSKLIVVVATFDGPEDDYGLRNKVIENLNSNFGNDNEITIIPVNDVISPWKGSEYAIKLGKRYLADIVIWGWYRPTDNPNITIHIENLTSADTLPIGTSTTFKPNISLAELKSFSYQQLAGEETSALLSFLAGYLSYTSGKYNDAIERFNQALTLTEEERLLGENRAEIYLYRANSYLSLAQYDLAFPDYNKVLELDPNSVEAYTNRGDAYLFSGQTDLAFQDYNKAVELDPKNVFAYIRRADIYISYGDYDNAIKDYTTANEIEHSYLIYTNRGNIYLTVGEYNLAIQDYTNAIKLFPKESSGYSNRGVAYSRLKNYSAAQADYLKAIKLNPSDSLPIYNMACLYGLQGEAPATIKWLRQAITMDKKALGWACIDTDFDSIRQEEEFQALLKEFGGCEGK